MKLFEKYPGLEPLWVNMPTTTREMEAWKPSIRSFGEQLIPDAIEVLRVEDEMHHYSAVLVLRAFDCEAWRVGFSADEFYYEVRRPGDSECLKVIPRSRG